MDCFRKDFPFFSSHDIIYLDSAATAQKPYPVIEAEKEYYERWNANPFRGSHGLAIKATELYEDGRRAVAEWIGAGRAEEIIFTRNATEALNLVALQYASRVLRPEDEIVLSIVEHHSNLLPWIRLAREKNASVRYLVPDSDGLMTENEIEKVISDKTRIVAVAHVSNVLGCTLPVQSIARIAHKHGAEVIVDATQSVQHMKVNVKDLGADFLAFSAHKMTGPMGVGVLYGRYELLEMMDPLFWGGEMVGSVSEEGWVLSGIPHCFEAGTVNAAGVYGLQQAILYLESAGIGRIREKVDSLARMFMEGAASESHLHILGSARPEEHNGIISFIMDDLPAEDVAAILDGESIAVRSGYHCAQPLFEHLGIRQAVRVSIFLYNNEEDIQRTLDVLLRIREMVS
ncbi:MAG: cysteine desulfurase [Lachnospiraceae bacterium]|nr:cysteine desulfurase [Lachnospiraceae bacterium]